MRKTIKIPRILKIEKIEGFKIYVMFNNGETRLLDFKKILDDWNVQKTDIEFKLYNELEFKKVKLINQTLSWENIPIRLIDENGNELDYPYEIGADVLFKLSQFSDLALKKYGDIIRKERIKAGLTQEELAHRAGITRFYISRFENNKSDIKLSTFRRIIESGLGKKMKLKIE
jgi:DNA-binding XRE family transcriptional regulator